MFVVTRAQRKIPLLLQRDFFYGWGLTPDGKMRKMCLRKCGRGGIFSCADMYTLKMRTLRLRKRRRYGAPAGQQICRVYKNEDDCGWNTPPLCKRAVRIMYVLAFAGVPSVLCCAIDLQFFDFFLCEAGGFGDNAYGNAEPLEVLCIFERLLVCTFSFPLASPSTSASSRCTAISTS